MANRKADPPAPCSRRADREVESMRERSRKSGCAQQSSSRDVSCVSSARAHHQSKAQTCRESNAVTHESKSAPPTTEGMGSSDRFGGRKDDASPPSSQEESRNRRRFEQAQEWSASSQAFGNGNLSAVVNRTAEQSSEKKKETGSSSITKVRSYAEVVKSELLAEQTDTGGRWMPRHLAGRRVRFAVGDTCAEFTSSAPPAFSLGPRYSIGPDCLQRQAQQSTQEQLGRTLHQDGDPRCVAATARVVHVSGRVPTECKDEFGAARCSQKLAGTSDQLQRQIDNPGVCMIQFDTPSLSPTKQHYTQSEQSLTFKRWAQGRCYRCLARDHQVRSCKDSFRCIRCRGPGHRERFCPLRASSSSSHARSNDSHSHQQRQPAQSRQKTRSWVDNASKYLLQSLQIELEPKFEALLTKVLQPIREELYTVKLWLARVATKLDCHEQDKGNVSASSFPELFGPCSPVRLPSTKFLDSFAEMCTLDAPLGCKDTKVDTPDSLMNQIMPKAAAIGDLTTASSPTSEFPQEKPVEHICQDLTKATAARTTSQVKDIASVKDALGDELSSGTLVTGEKPTSDNPSSNVTTTMGDENVVTSPSPITKRHRRASYDKSSLCRSARFTSRNILKNLGFIRKNGKLNESKLEVCADLLKELLPPDLLMSLLRLKGRVFWEAVAKIIGSLG